jgi:protein-L-isoaspartate(D-aspartate) O-methyltransferase
MHALKNLMAAAALGAAGACDMRPHDRDDTFSAARDVMISRDIRGRGVTNANVLAAMAAVPRHMFVPAPGRRLAYEDHPLPIGAGQTISQPYIVAAMTELIEPQPTHTLLEIGTGSGYQAAVLARLVSHVYTIEIVESLGREATGRLASMGFTNVSVRIGDGYQGWPEHAPFDGIIVTCGAENVPPPLVEQLKPGGKMVIPVGPAMGIQSLLLVEKDFAGKIHRRNIMDVRFVPLTGPSAR